MSKSVAKLVTYIQGNYYCVCRRIPDKPVLVNFSSLLNSELNHQTNNVQAQLYNTPFRIWVYSTMTENFKANVFYVNSSVQMKQAKNG